MPELRICDECRKPIRDEEDYVIPNKKEKSYEPQEWRYVHADCYKAP